MRLPYVVVGDERSEAMTEQEPDNWPETARMFARSADYWRNRAEAAERFYPVAWLWVVRRWVRNHITARVSWP